jgi:hypothetical protein
MRSYLRHIDVPEEISTARGDGTVEYPLQRCILNDPKEWQITKNTLISSGKSQTFLGGLTDLRSMNA